MNAELLILPERHQEQIENICLKPGALVTASTATQVPKPRPVYGFAVAMVPTNFQRGRFGNARRAGALA